jgi:hypothetical protein
MNEASITEFGVVNVCFGRTRSRIPVKANHRFW